MQVRGVAYVLAFGIFAAGIAVDLHRVGFGRVLVWRAAAGLAPALQVVNEAAACAKALAISASCAKVLNNDSKKQ